MLKLDKKTDVNIAKISEKIYYSYLLRNYKKQITGTT